LSIQTFMSSNSWSTSLSKPQPFIVIYNAGWAESNSDYKLLDEPGTEILFLLFFKYKNEIEDVEINFKTDENYSLEV
jgi:hypothetical protein